MPKNAKEPKALRGAGDEPLRSGGHIIAAVSGGADSTALLLWLVEAREREVVQGLSAVHVHHGLRGADADADEQFVRELCSRLGVPLEVRRVDTGARQAATGDGVEAAARELRYRVFEEMLECRLGETVATAHTADDQAETVLMKLLRGAWTDGLQGIAPELPLGAGRVVRPMLGVSRAEVERYLGERAQVWREDLSNADRAFTRNQLRHDVMPTLRRINPGLTETLGQVAALAAADDVYWRAEVARVLPGLLLPGKPVRGGGRAVSTAPGEAGFAMELERLRAQPAALQGRLIRAIARKLGVRLTFDETARVLALAGLGTHAAVSGRPGTRLELREGLRGERSVRELRLWRAARGPG